MTIDIDKHYVLFEEGYTCIILDDEVEVFRSKKRGVSPIIEFIETGIKTTGSITVIDKIIGRGAVFLAVKIGAKDIYTPIISKPASELAKVNGIHVTADKVVPYIINRTKDGRCPIESSVLDVTDVDIAYDKILSTLEELRKQN